MHSVAFRHCVSATRSGPLIGRLSRLRRVATLCRHGSSHAALLQTDMKRVVLVCVKCVKSCSLCSSFRWME